MSKLLRTKYHSWLWLIVGAALLPFTSLVPSLWLAAWIAPVFLLRFARTQRARVGIPLIALVQMIAAKPGQPSEQLGIGAARHECRQQRIFLGASDICRV